jgi:hypothetical protein
MRKYLLSTSALAGAALLSSAAVADVTISGYSEFGYNQNDHSVGVLDGNNMSLDQEVHINFSNKTDSGLTITAVNEFSSESSTNDDVFMTISGGFGSLKMGDSDSVASGYDFNALDLIQEESAGTLANNAAGTTGLATISTDSSIGGDNTRNISYSLPAVGGLSAGISIGTNETLVGSDDFTAFGVAYNMEANGANVTLGYASSTAEGATDTDRTSIGVKIAYGDFVIEAGNGSNESADEDISSQTIGLTYKVSDALSVGFATATAEDDLDAGEEYDANHYEAVYTVASGLTAVVTVSDFDYKMGTNADAATANYNGTTTQFKLKAAF